MFRHREFDSSELFGKYQTPLKSLAALTVTQNFCNNFLLSFSSMSWKLSFVTGSGEKALSVSLGNLLSAVAGSVFAYLSSR